MFNFIILTVSIMVALMLASALSMYIIFQPKVMKWYLGKMTKYMKTYTEILEEEFEKIEL